MNIWNPNNNKNSKIVKVRKWTKEKYMAGKKTLIFALSKEEPQKTTSTKKRIFLPLVFKKKKKKKKEGKPHTYTEIEDLEIAADVVGTICVPCWIWFICSCLCGGKELDAGSGGGGGGGCCLCRCVSSIGLTVGNPRKGLKSSCLASFLGGKSEGVDVDVEDGRPCSTGVVMTANRKRHRYQNQQLNPLETKLTKPIKRTITSNPPSESQKSGPATDRTKATPKTLHSRQKEWIFGQEFSDKIFRIQIWVDFGSDNSPIGGEKGGDRRKQASSPEGEEQQKLMWVSLSLSTFQIEF